MKLLLRVVDLVVDRVRERLSALRRCCGVACRRHSIVVGCLIHNFVLEEGLTPVVAGWL